MKIFKVFIIVVLCLSITSCDKDDETTSPVDAQSLIGSWSMTAFEADVDLSSSFEGLPINSSTNSVGENFDYTLIFTETTYTVEGSYDIVTTGTVNGIPIDTDRQTITDISETGTYSFDDGIIEFDGNAFDFESNDIEFSEFSGDQELSVSFDSNGNLVMTQVLETTIEEQGVAVSTAIDARIVLSPN